MFYVYIVQCADGTLYTGFTHDVGRRVTTHNAGKGAKYTRCRRPVKLVYLKACVGKGEALCEEHRLKKLSRARKLELITEYGAQCKQWGIPM